MTDPILSSPRFYTIPKDRADPRKITANDIERVLDAFRAYLQWKFLGVKIKAGDMLVTQPMEMRFDGVNRK